MFWTVLMPVTIFRSFVIVYLKREKDLLFLSSLSSFSLLSRLFAKTAGLPESGLCEYWGFEQPGATTDRSP
jgi:hypothetical protein